MITGTVIESVIQPAPLSEPVSVGFADVGAVMRLGWRLRLLRIGPFSESLSGTHWRSKRRRRPFWHGTLPDGWVCQHEHRREDTAVECANRELRGGVVRSFPWTSSVIRG